MKKYIFELHADGKVIDRFEATFTECRQRGNEQATSLVEVGLGDGLQCMCYNEDLHRWQKLGVFHGNMKYTDAFGVYCDINEDFSGITKVQEGGEL